MLTGQVSPTDFRTFLGTDMEPGEDRLRDVRVNSVSTHGRMERDLVLP